MNSNKVTKAFLFASVLLFAVSLCLPAIAVEDLNNNHKTIILYGWQVNGYVFLMSFAACWSFEFMIALKLFVLSTVHFLCLFFVISKRANKPSITIFVYSLMIIYSLMTWEQDIIHYQPLQFKIGYHLWMASVSIILVLNALYLILHIKTLIDERQSKKFY